MNIIVLLIILLLVFGGGGFYVGGPYVGGGLGTILLIILIVVLVRGNLTIPPDERHDQLPDAPLRHPGPIGFCYRAVEAEWVGRGNVGAMIGAP